MAVLCRERRYRRPGSEEIGLKKLAGLRLAPWTMGGRGSLGANA